MYAGEGREVNGQPASQQCAILLGTFTIGSVVEITWVCISHIWGMCDSHPAARLGQHACPCLLLCFLLLRERCLASVLLGSFGFDWYSFSWHLRILTRG